MNPRRLPRSITTCFVIAAALAGRPAHGQTTGAPLIPQADWSLHYVDSQESAAGAGAVNAFDGNASTMWTTQWQTASPKPPHEIQIDLGASYAISGFRYLPRQDGQPHGGIAKWAFFVSADGKSWGTAAATGTFPKTSAEQVVTFAVKTGRYVRLQALSEVNNKPWTAVAELRVHGTAASTAPQTSSIPQSGWSLHFVDSEEAGAGGGAVNAFDGNPATMWATQWQAGSPAPPHEVQIDLGASYAIGGFRYLPRQDGQPHGGIANWAFFVSADGASWGTAVATGTFSGTSGEKAITFAAKNGRYVRLRALSEVNGQAWTTAAEINVLGSLVSGGGNQAPMVSLAEWGTGPYIAPAVVALRASAQDPDGTISGIDFYSGSTRLAGDTTAPFDLTLQNLAAGTYAIVAVARDNTGISSTSNTVTVVVGDTVASTRALFSPSAEHETLVERYILEIFQAGADPSQADPVAALDLGVPPVVNGECDVDVTAAVEGLPPGTYFGTLTAVASSDSAESAPSPGFTR